jgi:hypothetical protein
MKTCAGFHATTLFRITRLHPPRSIYEVSSMVKHGLLTYKPVWPSGLKIVLFSCPSINSRGVPPCCYFFIRSSSKLEHVKPNRAVLQPLTWFTNG